MTGEETTDDDYTVDSGYEDDEFCNESGADKSVFDQSTHQESSLEQSVAEDEPLHPREATSPPDDRPQNALTDDGDCAIGEARSSPKVDDFHEIQIKELKEKEPPDPTNNEQGGNSPQNPPDSPSVKGRFTDEVNSLTGEDALRHKIMEAGERLVQEGEKNVHLALELENSKDELAQARAEINHFRQNLLQGINGGVDDVKNYMHVPLGEMLRLRLQEGDVINGGKDGPCHPDGDRTRQKTVLCHNGRNSVGGLQKLERELASERQRNDILEKRCSSLRDKLAAATRENQGADSLKRKIAQMVERSRTERELRGRAEREVGVANEKVEALSEHIEKLMIHLKHEAISKARALSDQVRTRREVDLLKARNQTMAKRNARKDRAIMELKEGAKILEDQLRLMDEKYMELRMKLDWTRNQTERTIKKKEEEARQLRAKFALVSELIPEVEAKGTTPLLDEYEFNSLEKAIAQAKGAATTGSLGSNGMKSKKGKKSITKGTVKRSTNLKSVGTKHKPQNQGIT